MQVVIAITAQDIRAGVRHSCRRCPIARAAGRALPGYDVRVFGEDLFLFERGRSNRLLKIVGLPEEVRNWRRDFDSGNRVFPLRLCIDVPR